MTPPNPLFPDPGADGTRSLFDDLAADYESPRNRAFYADIAASLTAHAEHFPVGPGACCLDLACGTGISTEVAVAARPEAEWFALDGSAGMLRFARAKESLRSVRFVHASADRTPFADHSFDGILCSIAYHWLPPAALPEIRRLLKPGGRLSLMVPLIAPAGKEAGNLWLGTILMRFARFVTARRSQGLTLPALKAELHDFHLDRAEVVDFTEEFASGRELLRTIESRSSLAAIFGPHAPEVRQHLAAEDHSTTGPLRFCWKIANVEARRA
jgi:ubiquinone/menaquinone biosynthesis C-methylase UbiE